MNTDISSACVCYGLYDNDKIIGFMGVLHQPHAENTKIKRVSRLVILPDYQGIGLGTQFLNLIAEYYKKQGFTFSIVTSAKNMIRALVKSDKWKMIRYSANNTSTQKSNKEYKRKSARTSVRTGEVPLCVTLAKTIRTKCKTASFQYSG